MKIGVWAGLMLALFGQVALAADTVLLTDNFDSASLDSSKWTLIKATGHTSFDETSAGSSVALGTYLWLKNTVVDAGGAYRSMLLPVDGRGEIVIWRKNYVDHKGGTLVSMPDEVVAEDGTVLLRWGYHNYNDGSTSRDGFGGFGGPETRVTGLWKAFFDETITYDPITGQGSYSLNGGTPVSISGIPIPAGATNLYVRGSAYGEGGLEYWKAIDDYSISQTDRKLLTISSPHGSPVPAVGAVAYDGGTTVTCSVANVTIDGIDYECTGWSGAGSVPLSGATNEVVFTLSEDSSITWKWRAILLEDDFEDGVLDPSKWTAIEATGFVSFNPTNVGSSVVESNGVLKISNDVNVHGGAYQTLLPVNDSGQIVITRRTQVHHESTDAYMTDALFSEDGTRLLSWAYFNLDFYNASGFASETETQILGPWLDGVWDEWFDETITYDPNTGLGTLLVNGEDFMLIVGGSAMPAGTTNVYLRGGTFAYGTGETKQFDSFTVSQEPPVTLLTVSSLRGTPAPAVGQAFHESGSLVTCSMDDVIADGVWYECTGWTGTGSVPSSGTTNEVVVQLNEESTITWTWQTNYWLEVETSGNGTVSEESGFYAKGTVLSLEASPDSGWVFIGWSGDVSGFENSSVTLDEPKSVQATFIDSSTTTLLLQDDFNDGVLNTSKWKRINISGSAGFDPLTEGSSVTETNGAMEVLQGTDFSSDGGAYQTSLLPVDDSGQIVITRRTRAGYRSSYPQGTYMTERLVSEDGTPLIVWKYYKGDYSSGFGSFDTDIDTLVPAVWREWFDETITYDPITGYGTYALNGAEPVFITGTPIPSGTTNVYLQGGAYGYYNGNYKQYDTFSVLQGEALDLSVLTVDSAYATPVPARGSAPYESGSMVTCSVPEVVSVGGWMTPVIRYQCTGWTGTGSVPASGTTNEVVVTLDEDSSITWNWVPLDAMVLVSGLNGTGFPSDSVSVYEIGSVVPFWVQSWVRINDIRWECTGWTGTGSVPASGTNYFAGMITIEEDSSITWQWKNLESKLTVVSAYGDPIPEVGSAIYPVGSKKLCLAPDPVHSSGTSHFCTGWRVDTYSDWIGSYMYKDSGTNEVMILTFDDPDLRLTWNWRTDHQLTVQVEGSGTVSQATGFYPEGSSQTLTATPAEGWVFDGWDGDASGSGSASVTMSGPKSVTAMFSTPASIANMSVAQVEGERTVEVTYDVAGTRPVLLDLEIYQNGSNLNAYVTGDLGMVSGTNKLIRWNAGVSWNHNVDELTFNLLSEDGLPFYALYDLSAPSLVPRTGQTNDFGYSGTDGDLQPGLEWPEPRFTDHGDGTATDNLTGLMWGTSYNSAYWGTAMQNCDNSTLAGHDDWRLPNVRELRSLFSDFSRYNPVLEPNVISGNPIGAFWTSTIFEYSPGYAYRVHSAIGEVYPYLISRSLTYPPYIDYYSAYYLPVRGSATGQVHVAKTGQIYSHSGYTTEDGDLQLGEAWPDPRFIDNGDGTATDNLTGLMWTKVTAGQQNWYNALSICGGMMTGGYDDWRLPSVLEVESLIDFGQKYPAPMLSVGHPFSGVVPTSSEAYHYWTSTTRQGATSYAYKTSFYDGRTYSSSKGGSSSVFLACRGGREGQESIPDPVGQYPLPKTGQTNSVAAGDDGDVQAGIASPTPRFQQTGVYTVLDNLTGLLWYINMDNQPYSEYWHSAVSGADGYINVVDWRLPNIREMLSLMDLGESSPALPAGHPFQNIQTNANYWTSTIYYDSESYAWQVNMADGSLSIANRYELNGQFYAMVYGPTAQPQAYVHKTGQTNSVVAGDDGAEQKGYVQTGDRFTDNGNYTISDNRTGLMWLQAVDSCGKMTWADAVEYCENLNYGGYTDWRLPNARELESLVDYSEGGYSGALPEDHPFTDMDLRRGSYFWSSTTLNSDTNMAVDLHLYTGILSGATKDIEKKVWPVRSGN